MHLPRGRRVLILGILAGVAASGGLAAFTMSSSGEQAAVPDPGPGQHGLLLELTERVVNLPSGPYRYVKLGVTVELRPADPGFYALTGEARATAEEAGLIDYESSVPILLDAMGQVVSGQDAAGLLKPEGRVALKARLLGEFRRVLGEAEVIDLYFTDLVMQ
jgi:flagellar basal body-associated protein FliL